MSAKFHKNSAGILASILIGFIILSFMFSGFQQRMGPKTADTIAEVDGTPIKVQEFQNMYDRQLNFYRQIFNRGNLTSEQIKKFQIKEKTLEGLIQQKIMINFSKKLNITPSEKEIANVIQGQEYFKNNGQFDINRYKMALSRAGLTPAEYEESIGQSIKLQGVTDMTRYIPVSKSYAKELLEIKKEILHIQGIQISKQSLTKFIDVSRAEIEAFLSDSENSKKLENYFNGRKAELDKPAEVKARHILMRVSESSSESGILKKMEEIHRKINNDNFAKLAKTHSEDPSGKDKGGELPPLTKGMTVPEFESVVFSLKEGEISKPFKSPFGFHIVQVLSQKEEVVATLDKYKHQIAKEILQKENTDGQKSLEEKLISEAKNLLLKNDNKGIQKFEKKYDAKFISNGSFSKLDNIIGPVNIPENEQAKLFANSTDKEKEFIINNPSEVVVLVSKRVSHQNNQETNLNERLIEERNNQQKQLSEQNQKSIYEILREKSKVKVFANL